MSSTEADVGLNPLPRRLAGHIWRFGIRSFRRTYRFSLRRARRLRSRSRSWATVVVTRLLRLGFVRRPLTKKVRYQRTLEWAAHRLPVPVAELVIVAGQQLHGDEYVNDTVDRVLLTGSDHARPRLFRAQLRALAPQSLDTAVTFGERQLPHADSFGRRELARLYVRLGAIERPLELFGEDSTELAVQKIRSQHRLLASGGFSISARAPRTPATKPGSVLYVASQSTPHHSSGYAIRTHALVNALHTAGADISVATRFGYPNDRFDFVGKPLVSREHVADGVTYRFTPDRRGFRQLPFEEYQEHAVSNLVSLAKQTRPAVLHGASNFQTGVVAIEAARRLGIPSVYEVRGLWHYTRAAKEPDFPQQDLFRLSDRLELQCANEADHVLAITNQIRLLLIDWGVADDKITLAPNCVDTASFQPHTADPQSSDRVTLGFIGSFAHYEGLGLLVQAMATLVERFGNRVHLLLVGDGSEYSTLQRLVRELDLGAHVTLTGRVPHAEVVNHYRQIDVLVYPRTGELVCEVVSPLKPLEAMAMGKAVVASDVAALADMVIDHETGLLHRKDDRDDLVDRLVEVIESSELRAEVGAGARRWVERERDWSVLAPTITSVYQDLCA